MSNLLVSVPVVLNDRIRVSISQNQQWVPVVRTSPRRTATKVRNGKVQKKNRLELADHYMHFKQDRLVFDRRRPGKGYKHYLTIADVKRFIQILPDWDQLSVGIDAIVLAERNGCLGWCWQGVIAICGWERELTLDWDLAFERDHAVILDRLGVRREPNQDDPEGIWCHFDEKSIKGFQLMHILLHELGHHVDRMSTKSKRDCPRGEGFAERYALRYADRLWEDYFREFSW